MTRVGIIGVGFMGMVHYLSWRKLQGVEVVAIAEPDEAKRAGDWRAIKGNFGPPGEVMDLSGVAAYATAEELIADANVDLVDITLPPAMHADVAVAALQAGKHVLCEKPMALTTEACNRMSDAAQQAQKNLMIAHVLPFNPEYAWALEEIRSGQHGKLLGGSFRRMISDPEWLTNYWKPEVIGGPMLDLHVHDAHFIRLAFGMPTGVVTRGSLRDGLAQHWHSVFDFAQPGIAVHAECDGAGQPGRPFLHGFELRLERATLMFEFAVLGDRSEYSCPPTILDADGAARTVELGDGDPMNAFQAELTHALAVVEQDAPPDALSCELARDAIEICRQQSEGLTKHLKQ